MQNLTEKRSLSWMRTAFVGVVALGIGGYLGSVFEKADDVKCLEPSPAGIDAVAYENGNLCIKGQGMSITIQIEEAFKNDPARGKLLKNWEDKATTDLSELKRKNLSAPNP